MRCPTCHDVAIVVEHNRIELDYCVRCRGVWFDSGELELLLEPLQGEGSQLAMSSLLSQPQTRTREHKRPCPICQKTMRKITVGDAPKILIDICPEGHGLWFDGGELDQLVAQLAQKDPVGNAASNPVIAFLSETFQAR